MREPVWAPRTVDWVLGDRDHQAAWDAAAPDVRRRLVRQAVFKGDPDTAATARLLQDVHAVWWQQYTSPGYWTVFLGLYVLMIAFGRIVLVMADRSPAGILPSFGGAFIGTLIGMAIAVGYRGPRRAASLTHAAARRPEAAAPTMPTTATTTDRLRAATPYVFGIGGLAILAVVVSGLPRSAPTLDELQQTLDASAADAPTLLCRDHFEGIDATFAVHRTADGGLATIRFNRSPDGTLEVADPSAAGVPTPALLDCDVASQG